ncbi:MAG: helix-turn-helix domain-containing protein [Aigarchaeota archaeon]|nr:helix-turn-helix domain-containing protein [Candidatus Caldarchaeales archaeon]
MQTDSSVSEMSEAIDDAKIFKSLASPNRLSILRKLEKSPLNYTELMHVLGMNKKSDAGKFAHHLKMLYAAGLITLNRQTKNYELTTKGVQVLKILSEIRSSISQRIKVRRSDMVLEDFDRNKITRVLVEEASMPPKTADKIVKLFEEKLEELKLGELSAPLIREMVNALLVEHGLMEHRNKLARLGMPIADVDKLLSENHRQRNFMSLITTASGAVFREYVFHKILPSEAARLYLVGAVDFEGLETWGFSVYSRLYTPDMLRTVLSELGGVEAEVVLRDPDIDENMLMLLLDSVQVFGRRLSVFYSEPRGNTYNRLAEARISATLPFDKSVARLAGEVLLVLAHGVVSSEGHPFGEAGIISAKASINMVNLFLKCGGSERKFWDMLREIVEIVAAAFSAKKRFLQRFWPGEEGSCVLSPVGVEQLVAKQGFGRVELVKKVAQECSGVDEDVVVLLGSRASRRAAERMKRLDELSLGVREVERITGDAPYSFDVASSSSREVRELARFFTGGLVAKMDLKMAEDLLDLRPLVVLSS